MKSIMYHASNSVSNRDEVRYQNEGLWSSTNDFQRQYTAVAYALRADLHSIIVTYDCWYCCRSCI